MEGQSKQNPACQLLISNYTKQTFKRNSLEKGQFSLLLGRLVELSSNFSQNAV
jgi:hypothetical protein